MKSRFLDFIKRRIKPRSSMPMGIVIVKPGEPEPEDDRIPGVRVIRIIPAKKRISDSKDASGDPGGRK